MENSLVVGEGMMVEFQSVFFATCLLHLQLLLQGFFFTKKKLNNHIVEIHKDLATLPCLPEQCNHCGKNF